jgi:hypothetical protein
MRDIMKATIGFERRGGKKGYEARDARRKASSGEEESCEIERRAAGFER